MAGTVLIVVDDLIFRSRIESAAQAAGVQVVGAEPGTVLKALEGANADAILLDLNHRSGAALEAIRAIKQDPAGTAIRVIGYLSHVQGDLAAAARAAGCDRVMARSAFVQELPELLRSLNGPAEHS